MNNLSVLFAGLAGLVSFFSPCILPLIPGYISYLAGTSLSKADGKRKDIFLNSLAFVVGFALVFALLGVALNTVLSVIAYDVQIWLSRIGGALILLFGVFLTGLVRVPFLERTHALSIQPRVRSRTLASCIFGAAFAAGWTPCVGAVLGAILGLAVNQPGSAFFLLLSYAIGFGVPFLLVGLFTTSAAHLIQRYAAATVWMNRFFGFLLIILGVLMLTQTLNRIAYIPFLPALLGEIR